MGRESKNYIADNLIELVDDLSAWDAYPWGEYFWRALYRRYILEMYRNNKFWWKKDPLVIPRGLAWSKIGNFEKGDYGALFAEWSNPILCMAPTSTELLQPWLIRSMDYFRTLLVDGQPNGPITASPEGIQPIICAAVVHDPQFEQQPKEVVESVPLFTSEELVAEYHSITTSVQLIENVGDGDPSIVLKELVAVKQRMNAIERFIKSRNDNLSEDSVAKQSVEKEIESSDGKADSAISNVLIGKIFCQNLVQEQLQSRDMCIQSITNKIVQHPLESPKGKRPESSISDVFHNELSVVETSKNETLSEEFDPKEYDKNVDESGDGKEYAEFDFDNTENDSLSDMVKNGEEEIHLDGLETVDDPFVQTPDKQNSEVFFFINVPKKHYCLGVLHIRTGVITLYGLLFSEAVETRKWWIKMRKAFKKYISQYLQEWGILYAKGIPLENQSFLCYMRPLIIIDGAHLKGNYLGTNLLAVGMDGVSPKLNRSWQPAKGDSQLV
ncbi:hypothetical protein Tco_0944019 [Tanacetum coccineum]